MSVNPEQAALPFYENSDLNDVRFPWISFEEVAERVFPLADATLDELKAHCEADPDPDDRHIIEGDRDIAFSQLVLALVMRCNQISMEFIEDGQKYNTVRSSMALRVIGAYFNTKHYVDSMYELDYLAKPLSYDDPLRGFVKSAITSVMLANPHKSEPAKEVSYAEFSLFSDEELKRAAE